MFLCNYFLCLVSKADSVIVNKYTDGNKNYKND